MATPITTKEFFEWVQKTFKECQDKAWKEDKKTLIKELLGVKND